MTWYLHEGRVNGSRLVIAVNNQLQHETVWRPHPSGSSSCKHDIGWPTEQAKAPPPVIIPCNCPLTINHLRIKCADFNNGRRRFYQSPLYRTFLRLSSGQARSDFRFLDFCAARSYAVQAFMKSCTVQAFMKSCAVQAFMKSCAVQAFMKSCAVQAFMKSCAVHAFMKSCAVQAFMKSCAVQAFMKSCAVQAFMKSCAVQAFMKSCAVQAFMKSCAVQAFMKSLWLLNALTCSRREDGLSCQHGGKPPLTPHPV